MKTNLWPWGIILTFVLFFGGMATVVVIAATHRESLVNANYYEQELKFQSRIDSAARGQKSGASIQLDAVAGKLLVTLPPEQVAQKLSGAIEFYRPSTPDLDHELSLAPNAEGKQTLDVAKLAAGAWHVRVRWNAGGHDYFLEQKITI